jgi:PAS domain S-box-containing protein
MRYSASPFSAKTTQLRSLHIIENQSIEFHLKLSRHLGLLVLITGALVLSGWLSGWGALTRALPGLRPMRLSAALSFVFLGLALIRFSRKQVRREGGARASRLVLTCCAPVLLLAGATLVQFFWDVCPPIEALFAPCLDPAAPVSTGRMSPLSAACFMFLASALALMEAVPARYRLWQSLTFVTLVLSAVGVLAYLYGATSLTRHFPYAAIPLQTSAAFVALSVGLLFSRPTQGVMAVFSSANYGGFAGKRLLPLSVLILATLGLLVRHGLSRLFGDPGASVVFVVVLGSVLNSVIIWWNAKRLNQLDETRVLAQAELRAANEELESRVRRRTQQLELQATMLRNMNQGVCLVNATDCAIVYANPKFESLFGYGTGELTGRPVTVLHYYGETSEESRKLAKKIMEGTLGNRSFTYEVRNVRKDGTPFWCRSTTSQFQHQEHGRVFVAVHEDITERKRMETQLYEHYQKAQEAVQIREDVLAFVSHDLKNPLSAILMNSQLLLKMELKDAALSERLNKVAETVRLAALRMQSLISGILDFAKVQGGTFAVEPKEQDLKPLLDSLFKTVMSLANAKSLRLAQEIEASLPSLHCDGNRVMQVLSNLLGNAIKFTPEGGAITVSARRQDGEVRISVSDTGPGIAPQQLPHIFERYWQAKETARQGTGLGLSIAKGVVDAHGGRIWVESVFGSGCVFHFTLPVYGHAGLRVGVARPKSAISGPA